MRSDRSALLLIDIQNDFCPGGALAVKDGDQVVPVANRMMNCFSMVVASQDWHPQNHGSFASNAKVPLFSEFALSGMAQVAWPDHCVQGSKGAEFHPDLRKDINVVFRKGMDSTVDSYSAFYDNNNDYDTGLHGFLEGGGIQKLYVMGLATDYCVKFTVLDALKLGYEVVVIKDGCRGVNMNPSDSDAALLEMQEAGAVVVTSEEARVARLEE